VTTKATCQACGRLVDSGATFCANCGSNVSAPQGQEVTRMMAPPAETQDTLLDRLRDVTLGEYEILTELGRGGMATVYLGHDLQLDRKVAIKVMLPELLTGEGMTERFKLEARTAAQLSHPHIIPIYAVRDQDDLLFFVMKFVEGRPLDSIVQETGQLPIPTAQSIIAKVGEALGYAHRRGVVHRDIKPANLMIDVEGMPVVTDFGIAKVADKRGLTMTGATIGTPTYMSPEQCAAGTITGASDQYSLGVVAYELLSGHPTFQGDSIVGLLYKHVHEPPPPFQNVRPDLPPALHDAVMKMLAKKPEDRFPNLEAAIEAFGNVSLSFDDPNRSKLIDLAKRGGNLHILARVSTPRSQPPVRSKTAKRTVQPARGTAAATPSQVAPAAAPPSGSSRALVAGGITLVAALGIGLAIWRPWSHGDAPVTPAATQGAPATIASLSVQPSTGVLDVSSTIQLTAVARDPNGQPFTTPITWTSEDPSVATVTDSGLVSAVSAGTARVRASVGAVQSWAQLTIAGAAPPPAPSTPGAAPAAVARIRIDGAPASMGAGGSAQLRALALDSRGALAGGRPATWLSSNPAVATVSPEGLVSAVAPGTVTLTARSGTITQTVALQITAARAASLALSAPSGPLAVGATARLTATARGEDGRTVNATVAWRSADPRVATVSDGLVTAVGGGSTVITASADGRDATANITVSAPEVARAPTPDPPRPVPAPVTAPSAADVRDAIGAVIQAYARALETRDIANVRQVYPTMPASQETRLTGFLASAEQLKVTFRLGAVDVQGEQATATVSGTYDFISPENHRSMRLPQNLQVTLEQGPSGWRLWSVR